MSGFEEQEVSTNKIPMLNGQENYVKWKVLFEVAVCYNDVDMWNFIKNGPYVAETVTNANQAVSERMRKMDDRALAMIKLGLSGEILTKVAHHTTAKAMYEAILEMFEGNSELKKIKKARLKQQLERFKYKEGERLKSILERYLAIVNELRTTNYVMTDSDLNSKLLSLLPKEWYIASKFIIQKPNFEELKLDDVICFLQAAKIEMIENEMIKEEIPCFQAFVGGSSSNLGSQSWFNVQLIDDNDSASMASGHLPYAGGNGGQGNETQAVLSMPNDIIGFDKSKVICYNCQQPEHFARECNQRRNFQGNQYQNQQPRNQNQYQQNQQPRNNNYNSFNNNPNSNNNYQQPPMNNQHVVPQNQNYQRNTNQNSPNAPNNNNRNNQNQPRNQGNVALAAQ
ncbi:uncharacterized protein LOC143608103 [Bidens hawaiensis]|uniref:uncharacterized protein LOC143608103 n=1 Tax=Bidens hawaiensis TaxID=980011 RepID=UPI00404B9B91